MANVPAVFALGVNNLRRSHMFNSTTSCDTQPHTLGQRPEPYRAQLFVDGEHTAADQETRRITLQVLEEIGVLENAMQHLTPDAQQSTIGKRKAEQIEKEICFMASFLRVANEVTYFGILMDRHRWTGKPCGYKAARTITRALLDSGYIQKVKDPKQYKNSTIYCCSPDLQERLFELADVLNFKRTRPHPIEVREPKPVGWGSPKKKRISLQRFSSDEVRYHQETVIKLNDHLADYPLVDAQGRNLDTTLRRIFTGDLRNGGRLYGSYQTLPEQDRLRCMIDGEPICEIDLKASHVAIAAAMYEHPERLPQDPYSAIKWVNTPLDRKAAKVVVQCIVHKYGGRPTRYPRQDKGIPFREKYALGDTRMEDLLPDVFEVMPFLDRTPSLTLFLQFIEAEILIDALLRLQFLGVPAFPVHDSLLVKRSDEEDVIRVLQETLRRHMGPHAPWLDVSIAGHVPRLIAPLPCDMDAEYQLLYTLEQSYSRLMANSLEYEEEIPEDNDGDF